MEPPMLDWEQEQQGLHRITGQQHLSSFICDCDTPVWLINSTIHCPYCRFGPAGDPRGAGIGTPEAIKLVWSCHREVIYDVGPVPLGWKVPASTWGTTATIQSTRGSCSKIESSWGQRKKWFGVTWNQWECYLSAYVCATIWASILHLIK